MGEGLKKGCLSPSSLSPTSSELLVLLLLVLSVDIRRSKGDVEVEEERLISSREEAREEEEEEKEEEELECGIWWSKESTFWFLRERNCIRRCLGFFTVYLVRYCRHILFVIKDQIK